MRTLLAVFAALVFLATLTGIRIAFEMPRTVPIAGAWHPFGPCRGHCSTVQVPTSFFPPDR